MSHELNNLLQILCSNVEGARRMVADQPEVGARLDAAMSAVQRIVAVLAQGPTGQAAAPEAPAADLVREPGREKVRVVLTEDDALVRITVASLLADMGHSVTEASTGSAALEALSRGADLLITDLNLPDMNGLDLADQAAATIPPIAVIVATGEFKDESSRHVWLQKPFNASRLRSAVKSALNAA